MVSHNLVWAIGIIVSIYAISICLASNETEIRERQKDGKGSISKNEAENNLIFQKTIISFDSFLALLHCHLQKYRM